MAYIGKSPSGTGVRSRFFYTQSTAGATSISGNDDDNRTLTFSDAEYVDVYLNGSLLAKGDYTAASNTISGLAALASGDIVEVVVYDIFSVADTVSAKDGGTFSGNVGMQGLTATTGDFSSNVSTTGTVGVGSSTVTGRFGTGVTVRRAVPEVHLKRDDGNGEGGVLLDNASSTQRLFVGTYNANQETHIGTNGTQRIIVDGSGRVTTPQQPTYQGNFNAVFGANFAYNTRVTAHIATVQNVGNMFNSSNYRWTVPVAGQYLFHVTVMKSGNSVSAGHLDMSFNGQGANVTYRLRMSEGATYDQPSMTVVRNMAANDYMELYYYGAPAIHSSHSSIAVRLLG